MEYWYCIYTKPNKEELVSRQLSQLLDLEVMHPKVKRKKYLKYKLMEVEEELFPSYIFTKLDPYKHTHMVKYTRGVNRFVGDTSGFPYIVDESIIEFLKSRMNEGFFSLEHPKFTKGGRVEINQGPFNGLQGILLDELKASERVLILLDAIGYQPKVEMSRDFVAQQSLS